MTGMRVGIGQSKGGKEEEGKGEWEGERETIRNTVRQCVCVRVLVLISYILFLSLSLYNLILTIHSSVARRTRCGVTWHG